MKIFWLISNSRFSSPAPWSLGSLDCKKLTSKELEDSSTLGLDRTIDIQFLKKSRRVSPQFFLDYFHHLLERGEGESSLVSGGCAVGEVVNKGGDALEAPAQEAEINFKLNLADRMLNFESF